MSSQEQSLAQRGQVKTAPAAGGEIDPPETDQAPTPTVYRQVRLPGRVRRGKQVLDGEPGNDNYLIGSDLADEIHGSQQQDILLGNAGDDALFGSGGNDVLFGDKGSDQLDGGEGDDTLDGGAGPGVLEGAGGDDILMGGPDADYLMGGDGHDLLIGGAGTDYLSGQQGDDVYHFDQGDGQDVIFNPGDGPFAREANDDQDRIEYGLDICQDQLWFQAVGRDLLVTNIETGDSQRVQQWHEGDAYRIDAFCLADGVTLRAERVDALVRAMASMPMPAIGTHHLAPSWQAALNPALAQGWQ